MASEQQETLPPVSRVFGLSEVSASLEALNIEVDRKPTVVHRAQASYSPGASMTPWSLNARDHRRSTQASPLRLKRYALQIWLEVEEGPGYFLPPEDNSYSTDFALEVLNHAYSGCMGMYLDRGGHMLAFYSQKGSSKAGLIQDVAIEAGHAVREIPTWMGLTAKWRVKCVSLVEAKDILAWCKRLEWENRRREHQYFQQKLRTLPYHAQTNGQVERMNQTIIRMISKLEQDKKARWSEHLPEMLAAYNGTRSAVTGYSPYFLLFGRKSRMPVDCLFPTLHDSPHQAKMEVSVAAMQKRLKEAFAVARHLTSQEAARQRRYYDRKARAVALQPGDVVMVRTDGFVGKRKVKDQWEDGGFIVESQLEDWPVYKVRCRTSDAKQKPKYRILHRNRLLLVTNEDDPVVPGQLAQAKVSPVVLNATPEAAGEDEGPSGPLPSLLT